MMMDLDAELAVISQKLDERGGRHKVFTLCLSGGYDWGCVFLGARAFSHWTCPDRGTIYAIPLG
ncbi:MAG: hypothetical protein KTR25_13940 [Myxococcales bacterium]|nr:hypothetical protein [Myxococcales bacterium]